MNNDNTNNDVDNNVEQDVRQDVMSDVSTQDTSDAMDTQTQQKSAVRRPERHHRRRPEDDKYFKIRNILNIIFMTGAVVGMAIFYFKDSTLGTIIILTAMAFKIAECCFRFIRQ